MGDEVKIIQIRCFGGEAQASTLARTLGPLGLSAKKVADDVSKETKAYEGLRVTVRLIIENRQASIEVVPSTAMLLLQALDEPLRNRKTEKNILHDGNLTLEQVYEVAKQMRERSQSHTFAGTVKEILGTCNSIGCTVEGQDPRDIQKQIDSGDVVPPSDAAEDEEEEDEEEEEEESEEE